MQKKNLFKKVLSCALSVAMVGSVLTTVGVGTKAEAAEAPSITLENTEFTGSAKGIATLLKEDYYPAGMGSVEIKWEYVELGTLASDNTIGYNDTIEFTVYDTSWGGWDTTSVGPNGVYSAPKEGETTTNPTVETGREYTATVPIATVESKLSTNNLVMGIYVQTGGIGTTKIKINSMKYSAEGFQSERTELTGAWTKTDDNDVPYGSVTLQKGFAVSYANAWNLPVEKFSVSTFKRPTVDVTVEYENVTPGYYQAEILDSEGHSIVSNVSNYSKVTEDGEVTYSTIIPKTMTSMLLAYAGGTVTKVEIYDDAEDSSATEITGLKNADIIGKLSPVWNVGNALEASDDDGNVSETAWGNPRIAKSLFKTVADAGFKGVRLPVSWFDAVSKQDGNYVIDDAKLTERMDRVNEIIDMAIENDLFIIVNMHNDGADNVTGSWLDVDDNTNQTKIRTTFSTIWEKIATRFKDYDQHLIFESMNEVMEQGNYNSDPNAVSQTTWDNINVLNQLFVETVREVGDGNETRFLLVPGYNTNIDQTVSDKFEMPEYRGSTEYEMVSVHFYDPYEFTDDMNSGKDTITEDELNNITTQFAKLKTTFVDKGIPVLVGEFSAIDKGKPEEIAKFIQKVVDTAKADGIGYAYWDNGVIGNGGTALWNRSTLKETELGKVLIPILTK